MPKIIRESKMPAAAKTAKPSPRIGGEAVKAKTGQTWNEWFKILDAAGGKTMTQRSQIVMKRTPSLQRVNLKGLKARLGS